MERNLKLSLSVTAQTAAAQRELQSLGRSVRPIAVPVDFTPQEIKGVGKGIGTEIRNALAGLTVGPDLAAFSQVARQFPVQQPSGSIPQMGVAARASGGNSGGLLAGLGGILTAPLRMVKDSARTMGQAYVFGIAQEVSRDFGRGIAKSINAAGAEIFGTTELLGTLAAQGFLGKLRAGLSLLPETVTQEMGNRVRASIGEEDVLIQGRAFRAQESQTRTERQGVAREELAQERTEILRDLQARRESAAQQIATINAQIAELSANTIEEARRLKDLIDRAAATDRSKLSEEDQGSLERVSRAAQIRFDALLSPIVALERQREEIEAELQAIAAENRAAKTRFQKLGSGAQRIQALESEFREIEREVVPIEREIGSLQQEGRRGTAVSGRLLNLLSEETDEQERQRIEALFKENADYLNQVARQIGDLQAQRQRLLGKMAEIDRQAQETPVTPRVVQDILRQELGELPAPERMPQVVRATSAMLRDDSEANYVIAGNFVRVRDDLYKAITEGGQLTTEQMLVLREELLHAIQFDFGSARGQEASSRWQPVVQVASDIDPSEIQELAATLDQYEKLFGSDVRQVELEAKVRARRGTDEYLEQQAKASASQDLFRQTGFAGSQLDAQLRPSIQAAEAEIASLEQEAAETGVNIAGKLEALGNLQSVISERIETTLGGLTKAATGDLSSDEIQDLKAQAQRRLMEIRILFQDIEKVRDVVRAEVAEIDAAPEAKSPSAGALTVGQTAEIATVEPPGGSTVGEVLDAIGGGAIVPAAQAAQAGLTVIGQSAWKLAEVVEGLVLDLIPAGRTIKAGTQFAAKNVAAPAGAFLAAGQVPGIAELEGLVMGAVGNIAERVAGSGAAQVGGVVQHALQAAIPSFIPGSEAIVSTLSAEITNLVGGVLSTTGVASAEALTAVLGGATLLNLLKKALHAGVDQARRALPAAGEALAETQVGQTVQGIGEFRLPFTVPSKERVQEMAFEAGEATAKVANKAMDVYDGVNSAVDRVKSVDPRSVAQAGRQAGAAVNEIGESVRDIGNAVDQTRRGVAREVADAAEAAKRIAKGDLSAAADLKDSLEGAASQVQRGFSEVSKGVERVKESAAKLITVRLPEGVELEDLSPPQLQGVQRQLSGKLQRAEAAESRGQTVLGGSAAIRRDLEVVQEAISIKATEVVEGTVQQVKAEIAGTTVDRADIFRAQSEALDQAFQSVEEQLRAKYANLKNSVKATQKAIRSGAPGAAEQGQAEASAQADAIFAQVAAVRAEIDEALAAIAEVGVDVFGGTQIRNRVAAIRGSLTKTERGAEQALARVGIQRDPDAEDSLASLRETIDVGAQGISDAFKSLIQRIFDVEGETLGQVAKAAVNSPLARDLTVNAASFLASSAVADQGMVAQLGADIVAALATRNSLAVSSPQLQESLGDDLFGDITGFLTGNLVNQVSGAAGSGAIAAAALVPRLKGLRDSVQSRMTPPEDEFGETLQSLRPIKTDAEIRYLQEVDKLLEEAQLVTSTLDSDPTNLDRLQLALVKLGQMFGTIPKHSPEIDAQLDELQKDVQRGTLPAVGETNVELQEAVLLAEEKVQRISEALEQIDQIELDVTEQLTKSQATLGQFGIPEGPTPGATPDLSSVTPAPDPAEMLAAYEEAFGQISGRLAEIRELPTPLLVSDLLQEAEDLEQQLLEVVRVINQLGQQSSDLAQFSARQGPVEQTYRPPATPDVDIEIAGLTGTFEANLEQIRQEGRRQMQSAKIDSKKTVEEAYVEGQQAIGEIEQSLAKFGMVQKAINDGTADSLNRFATSAKTALTSLVGEEAAGQFANKLNEISEGASKATQALGGLKNIAKTALGAFLAFAGMNTFNQFMQQAIGKASDLERVMATTGRLIEATGRAGRLSAKEIDDFAISLGEATLTSREAANQAAKVMLSFPAIEESLFFDALELSQDIAEVMGADMVSSARQLAMALEDPVQGISALRRSGTTFTKEQREQIQNLVDQNQLFEAQELILENIRGQYGGAAAAAAQGFAGSQDTLGERLNRLKEAIGAAVLSSATAAINALSGGVEFLLDVTEAGIGILNEFGSAVQFIKDRGVDLLELTGLPRLIDGIGEGLKNLIPEAARARLVAVAIGTALAIVVIPSIKALGVALTFLALKTLPLVAKAMTAVLAVNPLLVAGILAIAAAAAIAAPAAEELAIRLSGVSKAEIQAADELVEAGAKYSGALSRLLDGQRLSRKEFDAANQSLNRQTTAFQMLRDEGKLSEEGFRRVTKGVETKRAQLQRLFVATNEMAKAQAALTKELEKTATAYQEATAAAEQAALDRQAEIAEGNAFFYKSQQETRDAELAAEKQHSNAMLKLQQDRLRQVAGEQRKVRAMLSAARDERDIEQRQKDLEALNKEEIELNKSIAGLRRQAAQQIAQGREQAEANANEAIVQSAERQTATIERLERQRLHATQDLLNQRIISDEEANLKQIQSSRRRINDELHLERAKLLQLQALEPTRDRDVAEQRAKEIETTAARIEQLQIDQIKTIREIAQAEDQILASSYRRVTDAVEDATDLISAAETERQVAVQRLINIGVLDAEQANLAILQSDRRRIRDQIDLERRKILAIERLPRPDDPVEARNREREIRSARQQTANLTRELLKNEFDQQERIKELAIKRLKDEAELAKLVKDRQSEALDRQMEGYRKINAAIERQVQLTEAQNRLANSQTNLEQAKLQIEVDRVEDVSRRRRLEERLAAIQRRALLQQQEQARISTQVELDRARIAADRAVLEQRIAVLKAMQAKIDAEAALQEAALSGDPAALQRAALGLEIADRQLQVSQQILDESREGVAIERERASLIKDALLNEQKADRLKLAGDIAKRLEDPSRVSDFGAGRSRFPTPRRTPGASRETEESLFTGRDLSDLLRSIQPTNLGASAPGGMEFQRSVIDPAQLVALASQVNGIHQGVQALISETREAGRHAGSLSLKAGDIVAKEIQRKPVYQAPNSAASARRSARL